MSKLKAGAVPPTATEKSLFLIWEGWKVDLFLCEDGSLGITVDQPNPGMSTDPDAECPFVDIYVTPDLHVQAESQEIKSRSVRFPGESVQDFVTRRRKALGLSTDNFAELLGYSSSLIRNVENGHARGSERLARMLEQL